MKLMKRITAALTWQNAPQSTQRRTSRPKPSLGRGDAGGFSSPTGRAYVVPGHPKIKGPVAVSLTCEHCGQDIGPSAEQVVRSEAERLAAQAIDAAVTGEIAIPGAGSYTAQRIIGGNGRELSINIMRR